MEKFEQPKTPTNERPLETPKLENTKVGRSLYDINETGGNFEVILPGLIDKKRELIVGTRRENFATREEAERTIGKSKEDERITFEKASLEKTYGKYFFRIDETKDGKFRLILPGLGLGSESGYYIGTTSREFDSWDQAKEHFLQSKENEESLSQKPILEVQIGENEKIAFSELDAFNPKVAPAEQPQTIPRSIEKYLMGEGRLDGSGLGASTYQETIKEEGWEQKLFSFVLSYLEKDGAETMKELGIEHLDALTPKQGVELAMRIVIDLTKYKWGDARDAKNDIPLNPEKTGADKNTVQQLLQEGLSRKNDPSWEGNGICRNFASSVKAVFEALKANQTTFSQLRDTYALYEAGMDAFAPKRQRTNVTKLDIEPGHAWNTFVTISREGAANATIIDATWAKRNLDTREIEGLDHTLLRMEPVVNAIGKNISETTPNREEQLEHLLSYYAVKIEGSSQSRPEVPPIVELTEKEKAYFRDVAVKHFSEKYDLTNVNGDQLIALGYEFSMTIRKSQEQERERQFFTTRAVELMTKQGVPTELPKSLTGAINEEYKKIASDADGSEIETIYKISQNNSDISFDAILRNYLKEKPLDDHHAGTLISQDNNLQMKIFDQIKSHKDYQKLIVESPKFRARMREAVPGLFLDFSPGTKPEDARELRHLAEKSNFLRSSTFMIDANRPSEEKISRFFEKTRQSLRVISPEKYDVVAANLDNYQLIKQYDKLNKEFKS
jgi:hypothetical protein